MRRGLLLKVNSFTYPKYPNTIKLAQNTLAAAKQCPGNQQVVLTYISSENVKIYFLDLLQACYVYFVSYAAPSMCVDDLVEVCAEAGERVWPNSHLYTTLWVSLQYLHVDR